MRYAATTLLLIALCLTATPAKAQFSADWGAKVGLSYASLEVSDGGAYTYKQGFALGVFVHFALSERLSLQPEFLYVQKGATVERENASVDFPSSVDLRLNYLEVPLLLNYSVPVMGTLQLGFFVGGFGAVPITREASGGRVTIDFSEEVRDFDAGLMGGARLVFPLLEREGFFEVRYDLGLVDIAETEFEEFNTSTIVVLFGLGF